MRQDLVERFESDPDERLEQPQSNQTAVKKECLS
jgi:hypothetical protein